MSDVGHINMSKLAMLLIEADKQPKNVNGMVISLNGTISNAARALHEMAEAPDANEDPLEAHETKLYEVQPQLRAHSLEELSKHLAMLRRAINVGDVETVGKFFNTYVLE